MPEVLPDAVPAAAFNTLGALHQLSLEAFLCRSGTELAFRILNRTIVLAPYGRAVLWSFEDEKPKLMGVSGKSQAGERTPMIETYRELVATLERPEEAGILGAERFGANAGKWRAFAEGKVKGLSVLWQPILVDKHLVAGLWLERWEGHTPWDEKDIRMLASLMVAYGAAWEKLMVRSQWRRRLRKFLVSSHATTVAVVLLLICLIPGMVRLRIKAPCEVIPKDPLLIAAPLDGVIAEVLVEPDQAVKKNDPLFRYDRRVFDEELKVISQQVEITRRNLDRIKIEALKNQDAREELPYWKSSLAQDQTRLRAAQEKAKKLEVAAPAAGSVVIDSPQEWRGRPVVVGERVLSIVDPHKTRVVIWLSENDNIEFDRKEPVQIFLKAAPFTTLKAKLAYVANHVTVTPRGVPSFRAEADWLQKDLKIEIGQTGTAKVYGVKRVSIAYWILRKPWASFRSYFGW